MLSQLETIIMPDEQINGDGSSQIRLNPRTRKLFIIVWARLTELAERKLTLNQVLRVLAWCQYKGQPLPAAKGDLEKMLVEVEEWR